MPVSVMRLTTRHRDGSWSGSLRNRWELSHARAVDWMLSGLGLSRPTLLVSGFLRSGTTWLQEGLAESLRAKTVFEPLSPLEPRRRAVLARAFSGRPDAMHGTIPGPWSADDPVWGLLALACRGGLGSRFSMTCRRGRRESFSRRIVVKDVRLQFNLVAFHERFGTPVLHVSRHPCAVVASLLRARWGWSFDGFSLDETLPHSPEVWNRQVLRRDEVVARCDGDAISRIAALWAVTERFVALTLDGHPWARRATYEDCVADPQGSFSDLTRWLGTAVGPRPHLARPSALSHPAGGAGDTLSDRNAASIMAIADTVHPGWARRY